MIFWIYDHVYNEGNENSSTTSIMNHVHVDHQRSHMSRAVSNDLLEDNDLNMYYNTTTTLWENETTPSFLYHDNMARGFLWSKM